VAVVFKTNGHVLALHREKTSCLAKGLRKSALSFAVKVVKNKRATKRTKKLSCLDRNTEGQTTVKLIRAVRGDK